MSEAKSANEIDDPLVPIPRMIARHIPNNEAVIVAEAGHSSYWERPDYFNRKVLDFIRRHPRERPAKTSR